MPLDRLETMAVVAIKVAPEPAVPRVVPAAVSRAITAALVPRVVPVAVWLAPVAVA